MHFTIMRVIVLHLFALALAAPTANTAPKNVARDWMEKLGHFLWADQPSPWDYNSDPDVDRLLGPDEFYEPPPRRDITGNTRDLAGATSPSRRASPPGSQGGVVSKLGKRDLLDFVANLLGIALNPDSWVSAVSSYTQRSQTILETVGMQHDPLMIYLHDGANGFGQGLALAKANLLEKILVPASNKYVARNSVVKERMGEQASYTPRNLLDLLGKPQASTFRYIFDVTCPDGTTYRGDFVTASWELANLPEYLQGFPVLFSNEHNSENSKDKVFNVNGALYHSPMVDDHLETRKLGQYSVVTDGKGNYLGVVQDDGGAGYSVCKHEDREG